MFTKLPWKRPYLILPKEIMTHKLDTPPEERDDFEKGNTQVP